MDHPQATQPSDTQPSRWQPLDRFERRVLGVLIEKAKTTPENYPLSLNALKNGCNQKSNRFPSMQLEEEDVEETIERLREKGAVVVIQGGARVDKYRHLAYEWLGVDKIEIAVMGELLLRGAQTIGELRGRAARMEPIKDLGQLRPILDSLLAKNLIVFLTPEGRGAVVTHNLYQATELEKLRREHGGSFPSPAGPAPREATTAATTPDVAAAPVAQDVDRMPAPTVRGVQEGTDGLAERLLRIEDALNAMRHELCELREEAFSDIQELRDKLNDFSQQLGNL